MMGDSVTSALRDAHAWRGVLRTAVGAAVGVVLGGVILGGAGLVTAATSSGDRAIFEPLDPQRILDTRIGLGTVANSTAPIGEGDAIDLRVAGVGGVPADATAVVMNVTYTAATADSYLTVWPSGQPRPAASNLNTKAGSTAPNLVTVKLGVNGSVSIFNFAGSVHVIADVAGFYRAHDHDDRYYTKAEVDARLASLTGANIADRSLTLSDLGEGSNGYGDQTTTVSSPITLGPGQCQAQLTGNYGSAFEGYLVVGTLRDPQGNAVLPNVAAVMPSMVIKTTQGGAVPNLVVCNTGGGGSLVIPAGSVFHWRFIKP